jgi:uncharacterized phage protein gp47/JayE
MIKSKEDMLNSVLTNLRTKGGITETTKGSVARLIAESLIEEFYPLYEEIDIVDANHRPSEAKGAYLEEYGGLMQVEREAGEDDEAYRTRIYNQAPSLESGNKKALEYYLRRVAGVSSIRLVPFTHGPGSFTCYVFPTSYPISPDVLREVEAVIDDKGQFGVRYFIKVPKATPVDLYLSLVFKSATTNAERNFIRSSISASITKVINSLDMGEPLMINRVGQIISNSSPQVLDYAVYGLTVNDERRYVQNVQPRQDEQLFARTINIQ